MRKLGCGGLWVMIAVVAAGTLMAGCAQSVKSPATQPARVAVGGETWVDPARTLYNLDTGIETRSISFENPTGAPGQGGKAKSKLGVGRKGAPARGIKAGQMVQLCDIQGPGVIRHIWMTTHAKPEVERSLVVRAYWEGQEHPSIECPFGDFFGIAHGRAVAYASAVHSVSEKGGVNIWLPMPFTKQARITLTNEGKETIPLYMQIDYTLGDKLAEDVGRLHTLFRRENPTTEKKDFEILPLRQNKGRYIGTLLEVRNLHEHWWGEGEIKMYFDGDTEYPTICGTGSEDYVGMAYGVQKGTFPYNGCVMTENAFISVYRWHLPDPVVWKQAMRITMQQIRYENGLVETSDDWSCATFWYEPTPSAPLPPLPDVGARTADIWKEQ
jgi:hypothetical protein